MLLLDPTELLLNVHALHLCHTSGIFGWIGLPVVGQCRSLTPCFLFSRYSLTRSAVVDIVTLAGKALQVVCDVGGIDRRRISSLGLVALFLPARIEKFD
jgi:hypothetical protein